MDDLIVAAFSAAVIILSGFLGVFVTKKAIIEKTSVVFIGWRKNNRAVLRDKRLMPAYWKARIWMIWMILDVLTMLILVLFAAVRSNRMLAFGILAVGAASMAILAIAWSGSRARFNKLKNELGIVLEQDEDGVKKEIESSKKTYYPFHMFVYIFGTVIFTISSVMNFMQNRLFWGIFFTIIAAYYAIMLIIQAIKKKRGDVNGNSEN